MNSLSWMIYLADIVDHLSILSVMVMVFGGMASVLMTCILLGAYDELAPETSATLRRIVSPLRWAVFGAALVAVAIPSKQTIYAIAASELGQRVAQSPVGVQVQNEVIKTLQDWLKSHQKGEK